LKVTIGIELDNVFAGTLAKSKGGATKGIDGEEEVPTTLPAREEERAANVGRGNVCGESNVDKKTRMGGQGETVSKLIERSDLLNKSLREATTNN